MTMEAYASKISDKVRKDVLSEARQACYKARDAFYACLERESDKKPTEIASVGLLYPVQCKNPRNEYVKHCRPTWVKHFDRQYCATKRVKRLLDDNESRRDAVHIPKGPKQHILAAGLSMIRYVLVLYWIDVSCVSGYGGNWFWSA